MSTENVNQFYQVVLQDSALQQQFQSVTDEESLVNLAVELGQQQGYSFTSEEVAQTIALAQPSTETTGVVELADEQLEAVAGGKSIGDRLGDAAATAIGAVSGTIDAGVQAIEGKNPDFNEVMGQHIEVLREPARATVKGRFWPLF